MVELSEVKEVIEKILDENLQVIKEAHGGQHTCVYLPIDQEVKVMSLLRRKLKN